MHRARSQQLWLVTIKDPNDSPWAGPTGNLGRPTGIAEITLIFDADGNPFRINQSEHNAE
jgi:hypothetical protein